MNWSDGGGGGGGGGCLQGQDHIEGLYNQNITVKLFDCFYFLLN